MYRKSGALVQTFAAKDKQELVTFSVPSVHRVSRNVVNNLKPLGPSCKFAYIFVQFLKKLPFLTDFCKHPQNQFPENLSHVSRADTCEQTERRTNGERSMAE